MPNPKPVVAVLGDGPEMQKALHRLLACRDFCVGESTGGKDLFAAAGSPPPDCLLQDLHVTEVNGIHILETQ